MDKKLKNKLKSVLPANSYKKGKDWRGYTVFLPVYKRGFSPKLPQVVLQRSGVIRASSYQECFEYSIFANTPQSDKAKSILIKRTV